MERSQLYGYAKHQEQCATCDEQVRDALRYNEFKEQPPPEVLELSCGHVWTRVNVPSPDSQGEPSA